ncbi:membrane dipeptidase [Naviculisporaceae sp. PSN 640]
MGPLLSITSIISLSLLTALTQCQSTNWWDPPLRPTPDSSINITGAPFTTPANSNTIRGFIDAHNHPTSSFSFGGRLLCGEPFPSPASASITTTLQDCPEHYPNGTLALFDFLTNGGDGLHDPVGWPTFHSWPAHDSLTHQQNYYAWIERSWRAGLRVMVANLVANRVICEIYPFKDPDVLSNGGCDEMSSIRYQARKLYEMEAFIDGIFGGQGKGFFRIVKSSQEARTVIGQGKLAVVMGVEASELFGCKQVLDIPQCNRGDIDRGLDELHALGVRSLFLCHKFDNALCGVRFDEGVVGTAINAGQFLSTGTWWTTEECPGPQSDNPIGPITAEQKEEILAQLGLPKGLKIPEYTYAAVDGSPQCNVRGLTSLGEYALRGMIRRKMMVEIDHMSVKAAGKVLDILQAEKYPGVLSSHSWMDLDWTGRVYQLGGFIAQYMHDSEEFIAEAARTGGLRTQYSVGYGFGTDMNGLGGWPAPRNSSPVVTYPFTSVDGGSTIDRVTTGQRTWDFPTDGAAHYGLVPDWIEDIRVVGGQSVVDELFRGAESYLRTWGASENHTSQRRKKR